MTSASVVRPDWSPSRTWSIARPVSHGMATVMTIATAASAADHATPARYGRSQPSSLTNVAIGAPC